MHIAMYKCDIEGYKSEEVIYCTSYIEGLECLSCFIDLTWDLVGDSGKRILKAAKVDITSEMAKYNIEEYTNDTYECHRSTSLGFVSCNILTLKEFEKHKKKIVREKEKEISRIQKELKRLKKEYNRLLNN